MFSKVFNFLGQYSVTKKLFYSILLSFVLVLSYYLFLYSPQDQKIKLLLSQIKSFQVDAQIVHNNINLEDMSSLQDQLDQKNNFLDICNTSSRIQFVIDLMEDIGLTVLSCSAGKKSKDDSSEKVMYAFVFTGDFFRIYNFIEKLSLADLYIECKGLNLTNIEDGLLECRMLLLFLVLPERVVQ